MAQAWQGTYSRMQTPRRGWSVPGAAWARRAARPRPARCWSAMRCKHYTATHQPQPHTSHTHERADGRLTLAAARCSGVWPPSVSALASAPAASRRATAWNEPIANTPCDVAHLVLVPVRGRVQRLPQIQGRGVDVRATVGEATRVCVLNLRRRNCMMGTWPL